MMIADTVNQYIIPSFRFIHNNPEAPNAREEATKIFLCPHLSDAHPPIIEAGIPLNRVTKLILPTRSGDTPTISFKMNANMPPNELAIGLNVNEYTSIVKHPIKTVFSVKVKAIASLLKTLSFSKGGSF